MLILAALCAAFLLDDITRERTGIGPDPLPERWVFDGENPKAIQFISYVFVHLDRAHLESNCVLLLLAMTLCELRVGPLKLLTTFILSAFGTAVGFHLIDSRDLYGASGVVASTVMMSAVLWSTHKQTRWYWRTGPVLIAMGYFAFSEIIPAIQGHPNRGWHAHAAGALTGFVLGLLWALRQSVQPPTNGTVVTASPP